ncbi:hypothetical protein GCM10009808_16070 [Microbacterium sediminicola]|uniref:Uncharacterized protein n=1 Tax=Microbacterium sediminicola TaxID=415210 RepID=A0ABP4U949_9MICO
MASSRPLGVTIVALIAIFTAAVQITSGLFVLFGGGGIVYGLVSLVLGIVTLLVALGLFDGSNLARILTTIVFLLNIVESLYGAFSSTESFWTGVFGALLPVIGLILLYTARANRYFAD